MPCMGMFRSRFGWAAFVVALLMALPAPATEAGWALLRDGEHVVLLRHAMAPGGAEPANFDIDNCRTQRNLSERGRQQARKMGALFAARAEPADRVLSSRYCRTLDTARLAFDRNTIEPFAPLDPPPTDPAEAEAQRKAVLELIGGWSGSGNLMLVTHLETIRLLAGVEAREGEAVIVEPDGASLRVLGRIVFN